MTEIILSFFAVIGITLLTLQFFDFIFFRKFNPNLPLIVDLRNKDKKEIIETFELISTVRQKTSGKSAITKLIVLTKNTCDEKANIAKKYMEIFHIPGEIYDQNNQMWKDSY